jgi:hypothetical protein
MLAGDDLLGLAEEHLPFPASVRIRFSPEKDRPR